MAHSARQNDSFWKVKWAVLKCKMGHSASAKNVKKIQVLCFQSFRKLSEFAYLRPQDFNFRIIDSQSTFFDFLSKEFRTVSTAYGQRQQADENRRLSGQRRHESLSCLSPSCRRWQYSINNSVSTYRQSTAAERRSMRSSERKLMRQAKRMSAVVRGRSVVPMKGLSMSSPK